MAERYLVSSGDIEVAARWNGSTLPASSDDLYANGFTGTISASRTAASWRTTAGTTAVAGGGFACSTGGLSIGGNVITGTTNVLSFTHATGTTTVTGNVTGSATNGVDAITKPTNNGTLSIVGSITAGNVSNALGLRNGSAGTVNITGNVTGGNGNNTWGVGATNGTINIVGTVTGGSSSSGYGVYNSTSPTVINITGDAVGGTAAVGAFNNSTGTITVSGAAVGGTVAGVQGSATGTTTINTALFSSAGVSPIVGRVFFSNLSTATFQIRNAALTAKTLYPTDYSGLLPAVGDVRNGTSYNLGNSTGTLVSGRPSLPFTQQVIG